MRRLTRDEIELIWTIDRSEVHSHIYEVRAGQLVRRPRYFGAAASAVNGRGVRAT